MKKNIWILLIFTLLLAPAACGSATDNTPGTEIPNSATPEGGALDTIETAPQGQDSQATLPTRPTVTPAAADTAGPGNTQDSYPAPQVPAALSPEGYPMSVMVTLPDTAVYPLTAGYMWMSRAAGEQCGAEPISLPDAIQALQAAGVAVQGEHSVSLTSCGACGCPTGLHYRAQVAEGDVSAAEGLGWTVIEP